MGIAFDPHPDFELSRHVLGSEEIGRTRNLTFGGPEGKPLYIAGPDDADLRPTISGHGE